MAAPYDVTAPIETLWEQIEDAIEYAAAGNAPYSTPQVLNIAYDIIYKTGMFRDECKEWRRTAMHLKTWPAFKTLVGTAHRDLRRSQTTGSYGYSTANMVQNDKAHELLEQIAAATLEDRNTVENLETANATMAEKFNVLDAVQEKLKDLEAQVKALKKELDKKQNKKGNNNTNNNSNNNAKTGKRTLKYCWSCGVNRTHDSSGCTNKVEGHQNDATASNMMGSSAFGKRNQA